MNESVGKKIADLARLNLGDDEIAEYGEQMDEIILKLPIVIDRSGK